MTQYTALLMDVTVIEFRFFNQITKKKKKEKNMDN